MIIDIWLIKYSTVLKKFWRNQFSLALPTAKPKKVRAPQNGDYF